MVSNISSWYSEGRLWVIWWLFAIIYSIYSGSQSTYEVDAKTALF